MGFQGLHERKGLFSMMKTMVKDSGPLSLYKGFTPTMIGILPYAGISFYTYDSLKILLAQKYAEETTIEGRVKPVYQLICGGIAGAAAQTASYPLEIIRRKMQLAGMTAHTPVYRNTWHCARSIFHAEGLRGFFVGLSINYIKVVPAMSLSFATYEFLKKRIGI